MAAKKNDDIDLLDFEDDNQVDDAPEDLLDGLTEDNAVAWKPADDDFDGPDAIQGKVTERYEVENDYGDDMIPVIVVDTGETDSEGKPVEWSVRGYHSILKGEIEKKNPQPGDRVGIKYFGKRESKVKGHKPMEVYKMNVRKAA